MKYIAIVKKVLRTGIHMTGTIENGDLKATGFLPLPQRVEIILKGTANEPCMMYRWTESGEFCGDTWHENLKMAISQAAFEYGLTESDFTLFDNETE